MSNNPERAQPAPALQEQAESRVSATKAGVKEHVLYLAGSDSFEKNNCPVTFNDSQYKDFLSKRKSKKDSMTEVPVDFGKGIVHMPASSFFLLN